MRSKSPGLSPGLLLYLSLLSGMNIKNNVSYRLRCFSLQTLRVQNNATVSPLSPSFAQN